MITTQILSINPSEPTEGSLHPEALDLPLHIAFKAPTVKRPSGRAMERLILGVSDKTGKKLSFISLALRTLLSVFAAWAAITFLTGVAMIAILTLSGAILLSTFGRLSALATATLAIATLPTPIGIVLSVSAIAAALIGPGKLSLDYLVSRDIRQRARRRARRRANRPQIPFTYQAYRIASQR